MVSKDNQLKDTLLNEINNLNFIIKGGTNSKKIINYKNLLQKLYNKFIFEKNIIGGYNNPNCNHSNLKKINQICKVIQNLINSSDTFKQFWQNSKSYNDQDKYQECFTHFKKQIDQSISDFDLESLESEDNQPLQIHIPNQLKELFDQYNEDFIKQIKHCTTVNQDIENKLLNLTFTFFKSYLDIKPFLSKTQLEELNQLLQQCGLKKQELKGGNPNNPDNQIYNQLQNDLNDIISKFDFKLHFNCDEYKCDDKEFVFDNFKDILKQHFQYYFKNFKQTNKQYCFDTYNELKFTVWYNQSNSAWDVLKIIKDFDQKLIKNNNYQQTFNEIINICSEYDKQLENLYTEQSNAEKSTLNDENTRLEEEIETLRKEISTLNEDCEKEKINQLEQEKTNCDTQKDLQTKLEKQKQDLQEQLAAAQLEQTQLQEQLAAAQSKSKKELAEAQEKLEEALATAQSAKEQSQQELAEALATAQSAKEQSQQELAEAQEKLQKQNEDLENKLKSQSNEEQLPTDPVVSTEETRPSTTDLVDSTEETRPSTTDPAEKTSSSVEPSVEPTTDPVNSAAAQQEAEELRKAQEEFKELIDECENLITQLDESQDTTNQDIINFKSKLNEYSEITKEFSNKPNYELNKYKKQITNLKKLKSEIESYLKEIKIEKPAASSTDEQSSEKDDDEELLQQLLDLLDRIINPLQN